MDLGRTFLQACDLPFRIARHLSGAKADYRELLFADMCARLDGRRPGRILEIGPKDGDDTRRLAGLKPDRLVLVDLPNQQDRIAQWLPSLNDAPIELIVGNMMYDRQFDSIAPFDLVWCTGVLYHNPEQLRFVRQLFDLTAPGGLLVLESATARRARTRNENCVEIWYPHDESTSNAYHLSVNITHLPSRKAIESWLAMIGFRDIVRSDCHTRVTWSLGATRAAYIAQRPLDTDPGTYYWSAGLDYRIGCAR